MACDFVMKFFFAASQTCQNVLSLVTIDECLPKIQRQTPTMEIIVTDDHYQ